MMGQNLFLQSLSPGLVERLRLRMEELALGRVLYATGDRVETVHFPCSGAVSFVTEMRTGQMIESAVVGMDSVVGGGAALDDRDAMYKAVIQMAGTSYALSVEHARQVARDNEEFRTAILRHEQLILAQAQQSAACNAMHDVNQRLARWLLRLRDVVKSDSFTLTQEYVAEMLGVQRTTVSVVAHAFQDAGLIRYRRGHLSIERPQELQHKACECYAAVKARYERALGTSTPVAGRVS